MTNPRDRVEKIVGIDINPTRLGNAKLAFNKDFDQKFNSKMRRKTDLEIEVRFTWYCFECLSCICFKYESVVPFIFSYIVGVLPMNVILAYVELIL